MPDSPGVPADLARHTVSLPFNNLEAVADICRKIGDRIAGIIVEPVVGNMGVLVPKAEFLPGLREICDRHGIILIFDEVMTGFRVALGGAQELYGVLPDLTCLGKVIGGGLPVGAYGGRKEIMSRVSPEGPVYQAGTLSGNPLAMTAGIETIKLLKAPGAYRGLDELTKRLADGMLNAAKSRSIPVTANRVGSMFSLFFTGGPVFDYDTAKTSDTKRFADYFHLMLKLRIYLAPSQFEAGFVSLAHTEKDIDQTIQAAQTVFQSLT
jgi:glutamate-1-semialdehyde 2,1-aminomutase